MFWNHLMTTNEEGPNEEREAQIPFVCLNVVQLQFLCQFFQDFRTQVHFFFGNSQFKRPNWKKMEIQLIAAL